MMLYNLTSEYSDMSVFSSLFIFLTFCFLYIFLIISNSFGRRINFTLKISNGVIIKGKGKEKGELPLKKRWDNCHYSFLSLMNIILILVFQFRRNLEIKVLNHLSGSYLM